MFTTFPDRAVSGGTAVFFVTFKRLSRAQKMLTKTIWQDKVNTNADTADKGLGNRAGQARKVGRFKIQARLNKCSGQKESRCLED